MKQKKTCKRIVMFEPDLLPILEAQSVSLGTKGNRVRSVSDILRRSAKTIMLKNAPQLRNIAGIDWEEGYKI